MRFVGFLLTVAMLLVMTADATADIDPASDVLLLDNVYFPYEPRVCPELNDGLTKITDDAKKAKYPVKVALIASGTDLGGIPQVFGKPQEYAEFLHTEIRRQIDGVLLIAMPAGFGFAPPGKPEKAVLDEIDISDKADSNALARAAIDAIPQLAKAAGHTVTKPTIGSACSKKGGTSALIFIVPVALLLIAGAAITLGRRDRDES